MASFKSSPVYFSTLGVLGVVVLAAGWGVYNRNAVADKSVARVEQKRSELNVLQATQPAPTTASKEAVEADLQRTEVALSTMRDELRVRGPVAETLRTETLPSGPTEVFFNLENFVEKMRRQARDAGVKVKPDERFGFVTHSSSGPERELIPYVFRQRQVSEYLLNALITARPTEIVSLQRERPLTRAEKDAVAAGKPVPGSPGAGGGASTPGAADFFQIDRRISARVTDFVDATAFRLTFISESATLRTLLNKLALFELPLVVRSVEVEPMVGTSTSAPAQVVESGGLDAIFGTVPVVTDAPPPKPKPLVERQLSKFTVTVELIDLVETPATEATPTN